MAIQDIAPLLPDSVIAGGAGGSGVLGIIYWLFKRTNNRIDLVEKSVGFVEDEVKDVTLKVVEQKTHVLQCMSEAMRAIADFKSYAEGEYVKAKVLDRVHTRIDDVGKKTDEILKLLLEKKDR